MWGEALGEEEASELFAGPLAHVFGFVGGHAGAAAFAGAFGGGDEELGAGVRDGANEVKRGAGVGEVLDDIGADDEVKGSVEVEGWLLEVNSVEGGGDAELGGGFESGGLVDAGDIGTEGKDQFLELDAGAATDIEETLKVLGADEIGGPFVDAVLPFAVVGEAPGCPVGAFVAVGIDAEVGGLLAVVRGKAERGVACDV